MNTIYNPEYDPTGIEGGVDTNLLPWLAVPGFSGLEIKPLRASTETGTFTVVLRVKAGASLAGLVYLGAGDLFVLSGRMSWLDGPLTARLHTGVWGYVPANTRVGRLQAEDTTEALATFHGPLARLESGGGAIAALLTAQDLIALSRHAGVALVPNTLAECAMPRGAAPGVAAQPLAITGADASRRVTVQSVSAETCTSLGPHFLDTRCVPWIPTPGAEHIALKVLRVSAETGATSVIVRHNGVAGPHYHLGPADFMVLSGRIGYRAGPPQGYGPGVWFYEPAGARHEATQRLGEEDLIYTANLYGPIQFDSGRGTPILAVFSWMQYLEFARAGGAPLVASSLEHERAWLAVAGSPR